MAEFKTTGDIVKGVSSSDDNERLEATTFFRVRLSERLSTENTPPSKISIPSALVTQFVSFLDRKDFPELQIEAAKALTNIACGTSAHKKLVIRHGALEKFVGLLNSTGNVVHDLREQVVCALGNVAVDDYKDRDIVLRKGALTALLPHVNQPAKPSMLQNVVWTLSNLCSGKPHISLDQALSYISDGTTDHTEAVIDASVCTNLVHLLNDSSPSVLIPALDTVAKIASINDKLTQVQS
ncbi:Armadillo [Artemisia annua]|uniref:Armadillo n=1 Tax=Artemisia annua TaxID=35608 RepID=A0A2U1PTF0_ARTAN|nr:Armadillo [Artemisia annua]